MGTTIREELLHLFQTENEYISGQAISERLKCSRTAIWKNIEELRSEGYEIEAVQKKGYKLVKRPDTMTADVLSYQLNTNKIGQQIYHYDAVPSTQTIAYQLSQEGAEEGTVVIAEEQTNGKGRLDRSWHSPKGSGLWMSLIIRPLIAPQQAPQLTLLAAVAIVRAFEAELNITPEIKWPNDILINGKKAVGILTELHAETDRINAVIIGIGINVNTPKDAFPDEIKDKATSLSIEVEKHIDRAALARQLFRSFEKVYEEYMEHGFTVIKLLWESYSVSIGKKITARTLQGEIKGYAKGITDEGVLLIETEDGSIQSIYSADIEF